MTETRDELDNKEISLETKTLLEMAEEIISGTHRYQSPEEDPTSPPEAFSGSILDLNVAVDPDKAVLLSWITEKLGTPIEQAPVKTKYLSPDEQTTVTIFNVLLGSKDFPWFISKWQNQGEEPAFIFWPEEVYQMQVSESGYSEIS